MPGGKLHIGWSQVEITPPKKTLLQGQFYARLADTAISPLTATALAVETRTPNDSLEQAIFLSCDLAAEDFKSDLRAKLAGRVVWGSTSTSSPSMLPTRTMRRPYAPECTRSPRVTRTS